MLRRLLAVSALAGVVLLIYFNALSAYFFEDDFQWLVTRWSFRPADLLDLSGRTHFYRPIIELYFWIASPLFDGSPRAFHAASIALHAANGALVLLLASRLGMAPRFAFITALLFVVQPAYVAAVAWVGALAEAVVTFFGCWSMYALLRFSHSGRRVWLPLSVAAYTLALLTHESAVSLLPLIVLADRVAGRGPWTWRSFVRTYWPFLAVTAAYLAIDLTVNSRHYLVAEGQYRLGPHVVRNVFEYIASLYVGERALVWHIVVAIVGIAVLWRGTPRARFGLVWMVVAILPFAPFETGNVSRYAYLPAVGLAMVLAEGLAWLDRRAARRPGVVARAIVAALALGLAVRFGVFARDGVKDVVLRADTYRQFLISLRRDRPEIPDGGTVYVDPKTEQRMPHRFLEAAVQWEYRNPTIRLVVSDRPDSR